MPSQSPNKKRFPLLLVLLLASLGVFLVSFSVLAQERFGFEYGTGILLGTEDIRAVVFRVIRVILGFLGILALGVILYGGWLWMTAGGMPEKVDKAKKTLINAVIGLFIILASFALASFILNQLARVTGMKGFESCNFDVDPPRPCGLAGCGTQECLSTGYWGPCDTSACPGFEPTFFISKFSPPPPPPDAIRNVVVRITFNKNVDGDTLAGNIKINNEDLGVLVSGDLTSSGKKVEFRPDTPCPAPYEAYQCFDEWSEFLITVGSGSGGVLSDGGKELTCDASHPCESKFSTSDVIDSSPPTVKILNPGQICSDGTYPISAEAEDDYGIAYVDFYADGETGTDDDPTCTSPPDVTCSASAIIDFTSFSAGTEVNLQAKAFDKDDNSATSSFYKTIVRAGHCCNGELDELEGEIGIDCGGADCGACVAEACDLDAASPSCEAADYLCASGFCDLADCTCQQPPIIDWVDPLDGAEGNFITIGGRYFGDDPGTVTFLGDPDDSDDDVEADFPAAPCPETWQNNLVIVVVPGGAVSGPIMLTRFDSYSDQTNEAPGDLIDDFEVNYTERPGICQVDPAQGPFQEEVTVTGIKFGATQDADDNVFFGTNKAYRIDSWADEKITALVPNITPGSVTVKVKNDDEESNGYPFKVTTVTVGGPRIDYIDPSQGPVGQYITIFGDNFGTNKGTVYFKRPDGVDVAFLEEGFPEECRERWWNNTYIVVKVPEDTDDDLTDSDYPLVRVETKVGLQSNEVAFPVTSEAPGPGLCALVPDNGPTLRPIAAYGDNFGSAGMVRFWPTDESNPLPDGTDVTSGFSWSGQTISNILVPADTQSGSVWVKNSDGDDSNKIDYLVGACESDDDCETPNVCCLAGWYAGSCMTEADCEVVAPESAFGWSFKIGETIVGMPCYDAITAPGCSDTNPSCPMGYFCDASSCTCQIDPSFLPPQVVEDEDCTDHLQSPSPWKDSENVCTNVAISATFTTKIDNATLVNENIFVNGTAALGTIKVFDAGGGEEGFILYPDSDLVPSTTYTITLTDDISSEEEIALDGDGDGSAGGDYTWIFTTGEERCAPDKAEVMPAEALLIEIDAEQPYEAAVTSAECFILQGFDWSWDAIEEAVATVDETTSSSSNMARAEGEGKTKIWAEAIEGATPTGIKDYGNLTVSLVDFKVEDFWPNCETACENAAVGGQFNMEAQNITITSANIKFYDCGDNKNCPLEAVTTTPLVNLPTPEPYYIFDVGPPSLEAGHYYRVLLEDEITAWNGQTLTGLNYDAYRGEECDPSGSPGCASDCTHTGSLGTCGNGVIETGEDCDDGNDYGGDGCTDICLNEGADFDYQCGDSDTDPGEDCDDGNTQNGDGCSSNCLREGSSYSALEPPICGNGILEDEYEECDDGNATNGDGCSNRCLNEGSSPPFCGNGEVDYDLSAGYSEECDPSAGSRLCDPESCLWLGTTPEVECGNGKVEQGEDCDDGNPDPGDGCSAICLNEGNSSPICGNGVVDTTQPDTFSWVFKIGEIQGVCEVDRVAVSPAQAYVTFIGGEANYQAVPYGEPDECSILGQRLKAADYNWAWSEEEPLVATVTEEDPDYRAIATAVGEGAVHPEEKIQQTEIRTELEVVGPSCMISDDCADFFLICGYTSDDECPDDDPLDDVFYGVGANSCCYSQPKIVEISPPDDPGLTNPVCRNILLEATFDQLMDKDSLPGKVILEKNNKEVSCSVAYDDSANKSLLKRLFAFLKKLLGFEAKATPDNWCLVPGVTSSYTEEVDGEEKTVLNFSVRSETREAQEIPLDGAMRGFWKFNEGSGTQVIDYSGQDNYGTIPPDPNDPAWTEGKFGQALEFDGDGDYVKVNNSPSLNILENLSVEAWVKVEEDAPHQRTIIARHGNYKFFFNNGKIRLSDAQGHGLASNKESWTLGQWYHLVGVYEHSTDLDEQKISLYINGVLDKTDIPDGTGGWSPPDPDDNDLSIGGYYKTADGSLTYPFKGVIDSLALYNRVLSYQEVVSHYGWRTTSVLDPYKEYRVTVLKEVENQQGVEMAEDYDEWHFITSSEICDIDYIEVMITPPGEVSRKDLFTCAGRDDCEGDQATSATPPDISGNQHHWRAQAKDYSGQSLANIKYTWQTAQDDLINLADSSGVEAEEVEDQVIYLWTEPQKDAKGYVTVEAEGTTAEVGWASQKIEVRNFLCSNPWPSLEAFPYEDGEDNCTGGGTNCPNTHFEMYYCRDRGAEDTSDDLPELTNPDTVILGNYGLDPDVDGELIKEFLFLRTDDSVDAIGLRVYENSEHLSPERWYEKNVPNPGSPSSTEVDGYEAVRDGRTVYVAATNLSPPTLYTNLYLLSYSEGADADTKKIFDELLKSWHFNLNVSNNQTCVSNPPVFEPVLKWQWPAIGYQSDHDYTFGTHSSKGIKVKPAYHNVMSTPVVADLDRDGRPEVIFNTFAETSEFGFSPLHYEGIIRVARGDTGEEDLDFVNKTKEESSRVNAGTQIAVGDIDSDGGLEIVTGWAFRSSDPGYGLIAFEADGQVKWTRDDVYMASDSAVALADLNQDGKPEVLAQAWVLDGATGQDYWDINDEHGTFFAPADLDPGTPGLETITREGKAFYADGRDYWTSSFAGYAAVADFTGDGLPEVVFADPGNRLAIVQGTDGALLQDWALSAFDFRGQPVIADFDGDGLLEIGLGGETSYKVFEYNEVDPLCTWTVDDSSEGTGSSAFDFNSDGSYEILHFDEYHWRIFSVKNGCNGEAPVYEADNSSGTLREFPIVADLDNNGHAEIIVPSNDYIGGSSTTGIRVFEQENWPDTRALWNQFDYHITNVNDDGTIPQREEANWKKYNNFRAQAVYEGPVTCTKDEDCPGSICDAHKDKIRRDTLRYADLVEMTSLLGSYSEATLGVPQLGTGTYVPATSFSVWPSWQATLGNALGSGLPKDPINKFYGCEEPYNEVTCWDETNLVFMCPEEAYVYAYEATAPDEGGFYTNFEYEGTGTWQTIGLGGTYGACFTYLGTIAGDYDADGTLDPDDLCPKDPSCTTADADLDGLGDCCDECPSDAENDKDNDGICANEDNCPDDYNPSQADSGGSPDGDACDGGCTGDADDDGVCDNNDPCPTTYGVDTCFTCSDLDADGVCVEADNCPLTYNPGQANTDSAVSIILADDFNDNSLTWTSFNNTGQDVDVTEDNYEYLKIDKPDVGGDGWKMAGVQNTLSFEYEDFQVVARVKGDLIGSDCTECHDRVGIQVLDSAGKNYVSTIGQDQWAVWGGQVCFNGLGCGTAPVEPVYDGTYRIFKIVKVGSNIKIYYDDILLIDEVSQISGLKEIRLIIGVHSTPDPVTGYFDFVSVAEPGDACDTCTDTDDDGYGNLGFPLNDPAICPPDNCQYTQNASGKGVCIGDTDDGELCTTSTTCVSNYCSMAQEDEDGDGVGDACDHQTCGLRGVEPSEECDGAGGGGTGPEDQWACDEDCQWTGGWCGDKVVETAYGEQCDGDRYSDIDSCSGTCQWTCPPSYVEKSLTFAGESSVDLSSGQEVQPDLPPCRSTSGGGITVDATLHGVEPPSLDIVFISDLSFSMSEDDRANLRIGLKGALDYLFNYHQQAQVALVAFGGGFSTLPDTKCNNEAPVDGACGEPANLLSIQTNKGILDSIVDNYTTHMGGTYISLGVQSALNVLSGSTATNRIIVLMSDGIPDVGYDPSTLIDSAKSAGITIYTVAYTINPDLIETMKGWASDPKNDHAYSGVGDLTDMYEAILGTLPIIKIYIQGVATEITSDVDNLSLNIGPSTCQDPAWPVQFWAEFSGTGTIEFSDLKIKYCSY